jgi:arabinogalactan endo-1,4-beta-galactosidase
VKEASEGEQVSIMLHIDKGGSWAATQYFFDRIESNGVPFDIIGLSFYPWWHGTLEDLTENLKQCAHAYRKQLFVVETAYPWRTWNHGQRGDRAQRADEAMRWPHTPEGQRQFVADLASAVRDTPHGLGMGVLWWYPEAIPVSGVRVWNGGATALFNADGEPLPAQTAHMAVPQEQE